MRVFGGRNSICFFFCLAHFQSTKLYLDALLAPVLHCLDDPESRVRYYACESLYNIAKVPFETKLLPRIAARPIAAKATVHQYELMQYVLVLI